jgi:hypothetical protein
VLAGPSKAVAGSNFASLKANADSTLMSFLKQEEEVLKSPAKRVSPAGALAAAAAAETAAAPDM